MIYISYVVVTDKVVIGDFLDIQEHQSFDIKTHEEETKLILQLREQDHHIEKLKEVLKGK